MGENATSKAAPGHEPVADTSLNNASKGSFKDPVADTPLNNACIGCFNNTNNQSSGDEWEDVIGKGNIVYDKTSAMFWWGVMLTLPQKEVHWAILITPMKGISWLSMMVRLPNRSNII